MKRKTICEAMVLLGYIVTPAGNEGDATQSIENSKILVKSQRRREMHHGRPKFGETPKTNLD
jgi:hypothetical protein